MRQGDRWFLPHWVISTRNKRTAQLCFSPVYWHCETGNQQFIWFNATLPADKQHNVLFSARASTEWFITNEPKPWKRKHYLPTKSSNSSFHEIKCICQTEFDVWKYYTNMDDSRIKDSTAELDGQENISFVNTTRFTVPHWSCNLWITSGSLVNTFSTQWYVACWTQQA